MSDKNQLKEIFERNLKLKKPIKIVINLAAQAGVRYSIEKPSEYVKSNLIGFCNVLECCRQFEVSNFIIDYTGQIGFIRF